jgi:hypothetical protein
MRNATPSKTSIQDLPIPHILKNPSPTLSHPTLDPAEEETQELDLMDPSEWCPVTVLPVHRRTSGG